jgi:pyruvate/2-oxoglutarate dehydrogenase complex dihydrolipoamide dehydrogenase (E3) component
MSSPTFPPAAVPDDAFEQVRLANVHPDAWRNPEATRPYQLLVLGAGAAGIMAAETAAKLGVRVAIVERGLIGGTNLNTGCTPSKAIIRTSRLYAEMRNARRYGAQVPGDIEVDFAAVMERMRRIRAHLSGVDSVRRLVGMGIDVYFGDAQFSGRRSITVDGQTLQFNKALIATGARANVPDVPGLAEAGYLTNENVFDLTELPGRLLIIGGGPLGCEMAQAFCRFGSRTTIVQDKPLFLGKEERDAAQILSDAFARDGIEVRLNTKVVGVRVENGKKLVDLVSDDYRNTVTVDAIAAGIGHKPNVEGLNLEAAGVDYVEGEGVSVDDFLCTSNPDIYAAGDICLEHKYTHTADAAARIALQNALFRGRERQSKLVVPWCTFTDPEIAHVGLYVREANEQKIPVKTFTIPMHEVPRSITDSETDGFVKIHVREGTDTILGATIVASHAGDMINEITLAMVAGIGLRKLSKVIHPYPTQAEAIRMAADAYNRTRITPAIRERLRRWVAR